MRRFVLTILGALIAAQIACSVCFAAPTVTSPPGAFSSGWNLFALPAFPTEPAPAGVFDELGSDPGLRTGAMVRWDACAQELIFFTRPFADDFGDLLPGSGYWIKLKRGDPTTVSFAGITDQDSTDMWISLPRAGWTLIGHPYSYPSPDQEPGEPFYVGEAYPWQSVSVTDGIETKTLLDASQYRAHWMSSNAYSFDSLSQGMVTIGLPDDCPMCDSLVAWHGYWVRTYKDNLALIMEAKEP
ncbi:MAG TPA: hypothetical protein VMX94_02755 [Armatimonadota bacterium]|nr:hypothetical protein [Armatimonadota bacterium]